MDLCRIKELVEENYKLNVELIEKIKSIYKIKTKNKNYCLKFIKYDFGHFLFIISAIKHLQNNKFEYIPEIILTSKQKDHVNFQNEYAYLTPWIDSRQLNYNNHQDILLASYKLAELHKKSSGFEVTPGMNPRIGWFKWIKVFETRKNEIFSFKKIIDNNQNPTEFDYVYLNVMKEELERAERAIKNLIETRYVESMGEQILNKGFCHHDFANHNLLMSKDSKLNIIDFDYCILDSHLHDLSSLLLRCMKYGKWNMDTALDIIDAYNSVNEVKSDNIPIMASFMEFPQDYWQTGIQYYWEKQHWGEEFFLNKLKRIETDRQQKQEFIDEFRFKKYD
ncbi:CotS family spore coat protein [Clostridium sp. P21]|uniref:CotS family spore coat protein n=1 Tax=Clostridium muellerianum TaxID=2716538 RepID=A0A7Y0EFN5_9CLOT|nr:CotS family spore coat protein [Clostridium muellerianum]NMM61585.1 CotS family spore coat protein [Clostridium muellerianum]